MHQCLTCWSRRHRCRRSAPGNYRRLENGHRRGAAIVELAVCLPMIVLIVFLSIEAASLLFLKQTLVQSAYESVKIAASPNGTEALAIDAGERVAAGRNLQGVDIEFTPRNIETLRPGTPINVVVSAPGDANSVFPFGNFIGSTIVAEATMIKE